MNRIIETRESVVLRILQSSKKIESHIKLTYKRNHALVKRHPSVREEQMPIFVAFLYDLIIKMNGLPSQQEFIDEYMKKYYLNVVQDQMIYHAYVDRITKAYPSLVRDLHFYFKLSESGLFDDVQLSYAYDIEAKQDIVVTLGDKKLGLQLFNGNDSHIPYKKKQTERRRLSPGYPDFYMPVHGSKSRPINIGTEKDSFFVYSSADVKTVYEELICSPALREKFEEDTYILPDASVCEDTQVIKKTDSIFFRNSGFHSLIYVGERKIQENFEEVTDLLRKGIRIEWLSPHPVPSPEEYPKNLDKLLKNLRVHFWKKASQYTLKIYDGKYTELQAEILEIAGKDTGFNYEQYKTEHAPLEKHLIVEAGAGSGKTETMISRIVYLLHMGHLVTLDEIVMITFTNEAADQMKSKLFKRLYDLFELTGHIRYINWSEQVTAMRIMTIPSFAKTVIQDFSSDIGMGMEFAIRSFTVERRKIISDVLDWYITENNLGFKGLGEQKEYEILKMVENFWDQLEQKGIPLEHQKQIDWGQPPKKEMERSYFAMLQKVLFECEKKFSELKLEENAVTVGDLTKKINDVKPFLNLK